MDPVTRRQDARGSVRRDLDARELDTVMHGKPRPQIVDAGHVVDFSGPGEPAGAGDLIETDAAAGMADLHAGLGVMPVVEHRDREVGRPA